MPNPFEQIKAVTGASTPQDATELARNAALQPYKPPPVLAGNDPTNPSDGDHWVRPDANAIANSTTPEVRHQLNGATYKVGMTPATSPSPDSIMIGIMMPWAGIIAPTDARWLLCDGSILNRSDYPDLFSTISTSYNTGGETAAQFRVPDTRGRALIGAGTGTGLTGRTVGQQVGEETHLSTLAEMPSHTHTGSTGTDSHSHNPASDPHFITSIANTSPLSAAGSATSGLSWSWNTNTDTNSHSHSLTINNAGSGGAHNNMQPSLVAQFVIRALP